MKLIIAGSRTLSVTPEFIDNVIRLFNLKPTEIISGGAKGIDECAVNFAEQFNNPEYGVSFYYPGNKAEPKRSDPIILLLSNDLFKISLMTADWATHGRAAGPMRNKEMAKYGDALLLIWDGQSRGSSNMKDEMLKLNKPVYEVILRSYK